MKEGTSLNVLLISFGIKEFDGRLKELYDVAKRLGNVTYVSCGITKTTNTNEKIVLKKNKKYMSLSLYLNFLFTSLRAAKENKNIDVVVCDNFFSAIPVLIIKKIFKPTFIVQDVRELYLAEEAKTLSTKLFIYLEQMLMKKSDVVLCANEERSVIMHEKYNLNRSPLVFENIRILDTEFDSDTLDKKYKDYFLGEFNIISTGGASILRTTDVLVEAMRKLPSNFALYIVGGGEEKDKAEINKIIEKYDLKNVKIIGKVPLNELRYLVRKSDIGIVNYHQLDLNNKYCASGKVYEYLGEGIPIVTTENPPLKKLCSSAMIGEADDHFYEGLIKVSNNIEFYRSNVNKYMSNISVKEYNETIALEIKSSLKGKFSNA